MEESLAQIVRELQAGQQPEENFRKLFDRFYGPILRCLSRQGLGAETCEDCAQEVLARVFLEIREYRWEAPFEAWILQIARNRARKHFRHGQALKRRREEVALVADEVEPRLPEALIGGIGSARGSRPLEDFLGGERRRLLRTAIEALPRQMRRCMKLRLYQDLDYRQISEILLISEQTVKVHMFQARKRLGETLAGYFETAVGGGEEGQASSTKEDIDSVEA